MSDTPSAALFIKAEKQNNPNCLTANEWVQKTWYAYTVEYYSAINKDAVLSFVAMPVNQEGIMLSNIN